MNQNQKVIQPIEADTTKGINIMMENWRKKHGNNVPMFIVIFFIILLIIMYFFYKIL
jgi:hypothetical protein